MVATLFGMIFGWQAGSPMAPSFMACVQMETAVRKEMATKAGSKPLWSESLDSWNTVWGPETFRFAKQTPELARFRYRVPPDSQLKAVGGRSPFLIEVYENGFPTYGIRKNGDAELCRPLGFRYDAQGLCTNVSIQVFKGGRWAKVAMTKHEAMVLGKTMAANEYTDAVPVKYAPLIFGKPWIRITAKGFGDYWIDDNLVCIGPYGIAARIITEVKHQLEELAAGNYDRSG